MSTTMFTKYRLVGIIDPDTGDSTQGVERVVSVRDGTRVIEKQGRLVARSLREFRERYPKTKVEGAPVEENMRLEIEAMNPEQLAKMGVQRIVDSGELIEEPALDDVEGDGEASTPAEVEDASTSTVASFASEAAATLAAEHGLLLENFKVGAGSGFEGAYTKQDVREIADMVGNDAIVSG